MKTQKPSLIAIFLNCLLLAVLVAPVSSHARDPIKGVKQMQEGVKYAFWSYTDKRCTNDENNACISEEEYKAICKLTKSITESLPKSLAFDAFSLEDKSLLKGGDFSNISVSWGKAVQDGNFYCFYHFTVKGIYEGSSKRKDFEGVIVQFLKNSKGEVLAITPKM